MKARILVFCVAAMSILSGCSRSIEVPEGKFGVLMRFGKIENYVSGPGVIDKAIITESVVFIDKDGEVLIQGGAFRINYTVTNPKQHYIRFGVGREVLGQFIDNKLAEEDKENLDILNVIKSMDLPISIKNIESVKIRK